VRTLGVDYGRKRIGLALSDPTGLLARPWKTLPGSGSVRQAAASLAREIEGLAAEDDGLAVVVVGLPRRLSGEPNEQTLVVRSVVERLQALVGLPVELQDERLSSREAEHHLSRTEKDWRIRKPLLDAMAAAVILQDYLDGQARLRYPRSDGDEGLRAAEEPVDVDVEERVPDRTERQGR
jgi:putative Holliday junction resolvase